VSPDELLEATLAKALDAPVGREVDVDEVTRRALERARLEAHGERARRGRFVAGAAAAAAVLLGVGALWYALSRPAEPLADQRIAPDDLQTEEPPPDDARPGAALAATGDGARRAEPAGNEALAPSSGRPAAAPRSAAPSVESTPPPSRPRRRVDANRERLDHARTSLAHGDFDAVLQASAGQSGGTWLLLRADALRGLGRTDPAADAYEAAAGALTDARRVQAAFAAAQLRAGPDPASALALLRRHGVLTPRSALEERGRALEVQLLRSLRRDDEADTAELAYEARFGGSSD